MYAGILGGLDWLGDRVEVLVADTTFWERDFLTTLNRREASETSETENDLPIAVLIEASDELGIVD